MSNELDKINNDMSPTSGMSRASLEVDGANKKIALKAKESTICYALTATAVCVLAFIFREPLGDLIKSKKS